MILKVNYEIGEGRGIKYFKDKKIITKADIRQIEKYIEKKEGKKGVKIINWKKIGRCCASKRGKRLWKIMR